MIGGAAALFALFLLQSDSATFRDAVAAELYARARVRHVRQDALVRDYRATVRTRLEASVSRSRFARRHTLLAHESVAGVTWRAPNDLRIEVEGARLEAPVFGLLRGVARGLEAELAAELRDDLIGDRPWFIPRSLGDSIRVMGTPDHAALHPLADGATRFYRFAITDSMTIATATRTVHTLLLRVEPKLNGPSLVAGDLWVDAETADVVRFRMIFLGDYVWERPGPSAADSARARRESATVARYVSVEAEIEYALHQQQYWMPHRQYLVGTVRVPWVVSAVMPFAAVTEFSDYAINTGAVPAFAIPEHALTSEGRPRRERRAMGAITADSARPQSHEERRESGYYHGGVWRDGRWEVAVPPAARLDAHEWDGRLALTRDADEERRLRETVAGLAALEERVPPEWLHRPRLALGIENVADLMRFNRVQGVSIGTGVQWRTGIAFSTFLVKGRIGVADWRPTGAVTWRRDGPGGRLNVAAARTLRGVEPWASGAGFGHAVNALFTGHDEADYYLALGGGATYAWHAGLLRDVTVGLGYERHRSVPTATDWALPDAWGSATLPPNPAVRAGDWMRFTLGRDGWIGAVGFSQAIEVLASGDEAAGRGWVQLDAPFAVFQRSGRLVARTAAVRGDTLSQLALRLGGPATVRGYPYGVREGREAWSAQVDLALAANALVAPVAFVDVGDTFTGDPLVGVGVGLSLVRGFLRLNFAKGVRPDAPVRFDLLFRAPR